MESYLQENFGGVKSKNTTEEALQKWRKVCVLVVLAQNVFYNWCLCYTNLSSEISIENYSEKKCQS